VRLTIKSIFDQIPIGNKEKSTDVWSLHKLLHNVIMRFFQPCIFFYFFLLNEILSNASWLERFHIISRVSFADSTGIDPDILKIIGIFGCVFLRGDLNGDGGRR